MNKVITEAIGTFLWVFAVIGAGSQGSPLAAFAIGGTVMAAASAGSRVSGAHYNPAVSLAALIRGQLAASELPGYIGAQLAGASLASLLGSWVFRTGMTQPPAWSGRTLLTAIVVEALFTFFLAIVAMSLVEPNAGYALGVGGVVVAGTLLVTMQSGASFNPAVALGATFAQLSPWGNLWAYVAAQLVGGALAGVVVKALNAADAD